ncbi:MAG TPA: HlyD family efflux transporter periplasmic adaptor subunit [Flavisolibacter sp.]|nr:HlyD family efflux transporter periplasmic adaptor subunit [Flavisolibacter sp.]
MKVTPLMLLVLAMACRNSHESTRPMARNITESVYATGRVVSKEQYEVYAPVSGIVQTVHVQVGDTVSAGSPLLTLQHEAQRLAADNAQTTVQYHAVSNNRERIEEATANLSLAQVKLRQDSLLLVRQLRLWSQNIGSRMELEQRQLALKNAQSAFETARLELIKIQKQQELDQAQATGNYRISRAQLQDYTVRATHAGRIYAIPEKQGEMVLMQKPVAILGDAHTFYLELKVDEIDITRVNVGQEVFISMDSYKPKVFRGRVYSIDPIMEEDTHFFTVKANWEEAPPTLYPNLSVEASIIIQTKDKALTIPRNYLLGDSAVRLSDGTIRKVIIGLKDYQQAEVLQGLSVNDIIIKPAE